MSNRSEISTLNNKQFSFLRDQLLTWCFMSSDRIAVFRLPVLLTMKEIGPFNSYRPRVIKVQYRYRYGRPTVKWLIQWYTQKIYQPTYVLVDEQSIFPYKFIMEQFSRILSYMLDIITTKRSNYSRFKHLMNSTKCLVHDYSLYRRGKVLRWLCNDKFWVR